jgi:hypothetical protein
MKKHTQIYIKALGYHEQDFMPCEVSGHKGIDVHHIISRGKLGQDRIENLMLLARDRHIELGDKANQMVFLLNTHRDFLVDNGVKFNNEWFNEKINFYD